jgi:hypothetical protein
MASEIAREGGCQCGTVRYRLLGEPLDFYVCHCSECQHQSGSAFGMSLIVAAASFELVSGELKQFTRRCDSGGSLACCFCPTCGTRIHHRRGADSLTLSLKPGTLDDTSWLAPEQHIWTRSKQPWTPIPKASRRFDAEPA